MKKFKSLSILLTIVLIISTLISGCSRKTESSGQTKKVILNEVAHSIFYAPMYVAIEEGYFAAEGIDLELITGYGADKTMTALLTGEADIGFMGSEASIYTYLQGAQDYAVNFAQLTQRAGNFLVSRTPIDNFNWNMLKGTYVLGGRKGGMPQMVFEYILKMNQMNPDTDLTIDTSIDFGSTAAAFAGAKEGDAGYADFTVEFEPHATSLETQQKGYIVASLGVDSGYIPYTAFSARKSYIEENPDVLLSFTKALQKGIDYVASHSANEIATVIKPQFPETELNTITTIVTRYQTQDTWKKDLIFTEESFILLQNILMEAGELEDYIPYKDLVTRNFAEQAK
ncbi:MAG: ABC transporter substrate-binding protein [Lachnospiraceae bacterium]|jgi:ABC-type nitrate/sulfonate/bicarbonate transport systems, periplasmic components